MQKFSITLSSYFTETPLAETHDVKTHRSLPKGMVGHLCRKTELR